MTDPRNHVRAGQPLSLAAEQVNWINEQMRGNPGFGGGPLTLPQAPYTAMPCRNDTGAVIDRWSGVAIGLAVVPNSSGTAGTPQFERMPVLRATALEAGTTAWGVAIEPITAGGFGTVAVAGAVPCKVRIDKATDTEVTPEDGRLRTTRFGSGRLLWKDSGTGEGKWALVLLGAGDAMATAMVQWTDEWSVGTDKTVLLRDSTEEITARNEFAGVGPGEGWVVRHDGSWHLACVNLTMQPGYAAADTQLLGHDDSGILKWYSATECDTEAA